MSNAELNELCLSSGAKLIPKSKDKEGATGHAGSPTHRFSPLTSRVTFVLGERRHPERPKGDAMRPRGRRSLPTANRPVMWLVQISLIMGMLAVAVSVALVCALLETEGPRQEDGSAGLQLDMEGDNSTDPIAEAAIRSVHKLKAISTIADHAHEVAKLSAEKQPMVATGIVAAPASLVNEPGRPSTPTRLVLPHLRKSPQRTTAEKNLSATASEPMGSSSAVNGFSMEEGKDSHPGMLRTKGDEPQRQNRAQLRHLRGTKISKRTRRLRGTKTSKRTSDWTGKLWRKKEMGGSGSTSL